MESLVKSFEKLDPTEIINKGELVEISDQNKVKKSTSALSSLIIGVAAEEFVSNNKPTYYLGNVNMNQDTQDKLDVIISGIANVKVFGHVNIGDLLVSSDEPGKAKAVRYVDDKENTGNIIGKVIQYTEKEDEVVAIIFFA